MKILSIGDVHIRLNNLVLTDVLISRLNTICIEKKPDIIVLLGDILHDHARLHTSCLNKALLLISTLRKHAFLYVIVGNHDMESGALFLTKNHWMNALNHWEGIKIIDEPFRYENLLFCPYVPPGRLIEALDKMNNWRDANYLFCHQEFKGCNMGMVISEHGDEWNEEVNVISGHIHGSQTLGKVYYVGSSTPTSFSETKVRHILLLHTESDEREEILLELPKKETLNLTIEEVKEREFTVEKGDELRLLLNGTEDEYKTFKKSKEFKNLMKKNIKVVFQPPRKNEIINVHKDLSFNNIFNSEIQNLNINDNVRKTINKYRVRFEI